MSRLNAPLQLLATGLAAPHEDPLTFGASFEINRMGRCKMSFWDAVLGEDR